MNEVKIVRFLHSVHSCYVRLLESCDVRKGLQQPISTGTVGIARKVG